MGILACGICYICIIHNLWTIRFFVAIALPRNIIIITYKKSNFKWYVSIISDFKISKLLKIFAKLSFRRLIILTNISYLYSFCSNGISKSTIVFNKNHRRRKFGNELLDLHTGIHINKIERFIPYI